MASPPNHEPPEFRAPPPSPIADGRDRRAAVDDEELAEFLDYSLDQVPDLILPDRIFPSEIPVVDPPKIDIRCLIHPAEDDSYISKVLEAAGGFGCFQLVNHGIPRELIRSVRTAASQVFDISPEKKAMVSRSPERRYGFEEIFVEEEEENEEEASEEFYWCRCEEEDKGLKKAMDDIWPHGFSNFSSITERFWTEMEKVAGQVTQALLNKARGDPFCKEVEIRRACEEVAAPVLCLCKHGRDVVGVRELSSLKSDVIRMLIRRSDYPHALCMHVCGGASDFHVYSSRVGWMSFSPDEDALTVTFGDQMQEWSDGLYKHAVGRPVFHGEGAHAISLSFLYSPTNLSSGFSSEVATGDKTVSLQQQIVIGLFLTLMYHFLIYVYKMCYT